MAKKVIFDAMTGETTIEEIIDEITENIIPLEDLKLIKLEQLMDSYKSTIVSGFPSSATGEQIIYGYKQQDQLNYSKIANLFALDTNKTSTILGSESHGVVTLTKEQFLVFMADAETHEMNLYLKRKNIENSINNATTVEELEQISPAL